MRSVRGRTYAFGLMFARKRGAMLASMSATDWSEVDMAELLPTGTVTLLLADVEGSTQLWEPSRRR